MVSITGLRTDGKSVKERRMQEPMNGKVTYFYLSVSDLKAARTFYRDTLGLEEAWREGETTCAFKLPGTEVQLMLDQNEHNTSGRSGLVFMVPNTDTFYTQRRGNLDFHAPPMDIPGGGRWVGANDGSGNSVYVGDIQ